MLLACVIAALWLTRDTAAKTKPAVDARDPAAYEQVRWSNLDTAVWAVRDTGDRDDRARQQRGVDSKARPHGEFSTGLLDAHGTPKAAARTFRANLFVALRRRDRHALLYGRLRLGSARQAVMVQRRVGKRRWKTIARLTING